MFYGGPLVTSRLRVCKLLLRIHSTVPCLATIGVSASSVQPSHCLRLAAVSARASSAHPLISVRASLVHLFDSLCHCLRPAIISARASSVHLSSLQELHRRITAFITAFVLRPSTREFRQHILLTAFTIALVVRELRRRVLLPLRELRRRILLTAFVTAFVLQP
nr:hypothetical protein CFP56_79437 [Quercus suber]